MPVVGKFRECAGCKRKTYNRVIPAPPTVPVPGLGEVPVIRAYRCVECQTEDLCLGENQGVDLHVISTGA